MRLLKLGCSGEPEDLPGDDIPPYAILSHTWGPAPEEVTFKDLVDGTGKDKVGWKKIQFCAERAKQDDLQYFWVDTCCIDKANNTELSEAIICMFRWYKKAAKCYVYLADVSNQPSWESTFRKSRWFTRGWTLQELLAPASVEFFSKEAVWLGDKRSLEEHIRDITGIPLDALRGRPLPNFSVPERMAWVGGRKTTREEDMAYSLFGIFDTHMPLLYGEGRERAFKRLWKEGEGAAESEVDWKLQQQRFAQLQDEDHQCLRDLRLTDPRKDKERIESEKGGLFEDSYKWILDHPDFLKWRSNDQTGLLWIKGDPGKGKTMLLIGLINELGKSISPSDSVQSFFLCQATNAELNNATAILRGLIYMLVVQQSYLISHLKDQYKGAGKRLFEDPNAFFALSDIFQKMVADEKLRKAYLIVDGLDECTEDLHRLLDLIRDSSAHPRVKWLVSSRNWSSIEKVLDNTPQRTRLDLELNENSISAAVTTYICHKVDSLAKKQRYDRDTRAAVQNHLLSNAEGTFLWVALVCHELADIFSWDAEEKVKSFPPGLDPFYQRMMDQILRSRYAELCKSILAIASTVYRPLTLDELAICADLPKGLSDNREDLEEIVGLCGSFLTLHFSSISFIHQSAKDYLTTKANATIYPAGKPGPIHFDIGRRSLAAMSKTLCRDIYNLHQPGIRIPDIKTPIPDPLADVRYSCIYWVDHLRDCHPTERVAEEDLQDGGSIDRFLRQNYLPWLEALSLLESMSEGVASMLSLEIMLQVR